MVSSRANAFRRTFIVLLLLSVASVIGSPSQGAIAPRIRIARTVRVGITEYEKQTYDNYRVLFTELANSAGPEDSVTFEFALGTYGEVLDWYNKRTIDVAILSAMPMAELLLAGQVDNLDRAYVGDLSVSPALAVAAPNDPYSYRSQCLVLDADKKLQTLADIRDLWKQGKVKFLFVRPYSLSGYLLPLHVLNRNGIPVLSKPEQLAFAYSHTAAFGERVGLSQPVKPDTHLVAFVRDGIDLRPRVEADGRPSWGALRQISIPELDNYAIPREVVLANYNQDKNEPDGNKFEETRALMTRLFANWKARKSSRSAGSRETRVTTSNHPVIEFKQKKPKWEHAYKDVQTALVDLGLPNQLLQKSTLDELLDDLKNTPSPRLALVLSGGGAKCAYQAGAIVEIERRLKEKNLDIDLVVGTSGGAINALLVAMDVTVDPNSRGPLGDTWKSFKQQQFIQPSLRFNVMFGVVFGLLQSLLIYVAVLLFGRQAMNWVATVLAFLALLMVETLLDVIYFHSSPGTLKAVVIVEAVSFLVAVLVVIVAGWFIEAIERFILRKPPRVGDIEDPLRWRKLTIVVMMFAGLLEALIARTAFAGEHLDRISNNHWMEHAWTIVILACTWSFPYPLVFGILMTALGWKVWKSFNWNQRRESLFWWTAITLIAVSGLLVLDALFIEGSPSKAGGIEEAFSREMPKLIRATVKPDFEASNGSGASLEELSRQIMNDNLLKRDLVITTTRLPASGTDEPFSANNLPRALYFYFSKPGNSVKPPPDNRFVPLKYNQEKLLDIVIGSSTIYPIFPSRPLTNVQLGNEDQKLTLPPNAKIDMRIIDGGFVHNVPIEAASLWRATHIILVEASPAPQQHKPQHFWDNLMAAFGYLFALAQHDDILADDAAEKFELRPTSECEKRNIRAVCTDAETDGRPEPDLDTFDFSRSAAERAFDIGRRDVMSTSPLFVRISGAPVFKTVTADSQLANHP